MSELLRRQGLRLVALACDADGGKKADALMRKAHLPLRYRFRAQSAAAGDALDYIGLAETRRVVLLCAVPRALAARLVGALRRELHLGRPGNGVLLSVPVSGASNPLAGLMDVETREGIQTQIESEVQKMEEGAKFSLVLAAVNPGYSEAVMEAAKGAGVQEGTVIRARRLGMEDAMQFWGITLQSEKDIVALLVPRDKKLALMRIIGEKCGVQSEARGLVISLPVDEVAGLGQDM